MKKENIVHEISWKRERIWWTEYCEKERRLLAKERIWWIKYEIEIWWTEHCEKRDRIWWTEEWDKMKFGERKIVKKDRI